MENKVWLNVYLDKNLNISARATGITDAMKRITKQATGLDDAFDRLKKSLVDFNDQGNRTRASFKIMIDQFRDINVELRKVSGVWQLANQRITENAEARRKAADRARELIRLQKEEVAAIRETNRARQRAATFVSGLQAPQTTDPTRLFNFAQATGRLQEFIVQNKIGAEEIQTIWAQVQAGVFKPYTGNLRQLQGLMRNVTKTQQTFGKTSQENLEKTKKATQSLTLSWQTMGRIILAQLVRRALTAFIGAIRESIDLARQFSIAVSEIRTISQENQLAAEEWAAGLRDVSDAFGLDILETAEAAYQTLSNQVAKGAETFKFLAETSKFSIVTTASASDSVNLLTAAINSFGLNADDAGRVAAVMFKTIELGRVRASEMANSFGDVAVIASQLGITLEELTASISTLTIQGIKYNKAATQLRGIFIKLIKPTKEMQAFLRELGVDSGEAAIQTFGLGKFLALLQERTQGSTTELAKLVNRIRGITGALALTGSGLDTFNKNLEANRKAAESYNKAVRIAFENTGRNVTIELNKIKNFFVNDFGNAILEGINEMSEDLGGFSELIKAFAQTVTGASRSIVSAIGAVSAALALLATSNPFGALIAAVGVATLAVSTALNRIANASEAADQEFRERVQRRIQIENNAVAATFKLVTDSIEARARVSRQLTAQLIALDNKRLDNLTKTILEINDLVEENSKALLKGLNKDITATENTIKKALRGIEQLTQDISKSLRKQEEIEFKFKLETAESAKEQAELLTDAITKELNESQKEISKETGLIDVKNLQSSLKQAEKLFDDFLKIVVKNDAEAVKASDKIRKLQLDNVRKIAKLEEKLAAETDPKKRLEIEQKINDENDKTADKLEDQLKILQQALTLETDENEAIKQRRVLIEELNKTRLDGIKALERERKDQERRLGIQKELRAEVIEINSLVKKFDLEEVLGLKDAEAIDKALQQQQGNLARQLELREQLNSKRGDEEDIAKEILKLEAQRNIVKSIEAQRARGVAIEKDVKATKQLFKDQEAIVKSKTAEAIQQDEQIKKQIEALKAQRDLAAKGPAIFPDLTAEEATLRVKELNEAIKLAETLRTDEGLKDFDKNIDRLEELQKRFIEKPLFASDRVAITGITTGIENLVKKEALSLGVILNNLKNTPLFDFKKSREELDSFAKKFAESTKKFLESQKAAKDTAKEFQGIVKGTDSLSAALFKLTGQLKAFNDQTKRRIFERGGGGFVIGGQEQIFGQPDIQERRAKGGIINTYGKDKVPALLSPGEFVVNSRASKKFFSQLLTMNAGSIPRFQSGGEVTNVGDVNISLQSSGRESVDIVRIGKGLRRAIRQGRVKL